MTYRDQKNKMEDLKRVEWKIKGRDLEDYRMFRKRHLDEEEFDTVSARRLEELHATYVVKSDKSDRSKYDKFFKK
ncbi:MAG: hypothetical protein GF419_13780 [Ignavibacteriales bacterium]|nr:hypothetical protein [Ignavibacteriales bacterium]